MGNIVFWIVVLAVVAAIVVGGAVFYKAYASGTSPRDVFFKPRAEPRIEVVEHASVDGKRKLILIRRDDVEHLIMTGGPVDVVIETGIGGEAARAADVSTPAATTASTATVFTRAPRAFGQASSAASGPASPSLAIDESEVAIKRS
jgi:flagellar protein FliO/FliZ